MNLVSLSIPYEFVTAKTTLTWREVRFGIVRELLSLEAPAELAAALLATEATPHPAVLELACLDRGESVMPALDGLADGEPEPPPGAIEDKWLFLVLSWVFTHREEFDNPLQTVEMVYADFDYPESMAGFVAYMPSTEAIRGDVSSNEPRLYENWVEWLRQHAEKYARNEANHDAIETAT